MTKKLCDIVWPLKLITTPTTGESRFVVKDGADDVVGVLYNFNALSAARMISAFNGYGRAMLAFQSTGDTGLNSPTPSFAWPAWAGETPRYGCQWTDAEDALLIKRWYDGMSKNNIAKELGRDCGGVEARLQRRLGANYEEQHGRYHKRRTQLARIEKALKEALVLMSEFES